MTIATPSSARSWPDCPPLYGTPRTPERETLGPAVAEVAAALGKAFKPHQRHITDVALEIDPETGLLAYREVVLVMMRQQGKSELVLPLTTWRAMAWADQRILYASHIAAEARRRWEDVHLKRLDASPFRSFYRPRLRLAQEAILWRNGSSYSPMSTTSKTGGTGDSVDLGVLDEAWSHEDSGAEQSLRPAMLTREQPQLWVCSMVPGPTRLKSTDWAYLRKKMSVGQARVRAGLTRDIAYFEFAARPGLDPGDPATWWSCMPALGHLITEAAVRADFESMERDDFTTEYLGWPIIGRNAKWQVISEGEWELARDPDSQPLDPVALAVAVDPDRTVAAIAASGSRTDGLRHVEITGSAEEPDHRSGTPTWVIPRLLQMVDAHRPCAVVVGDRALADAAEAAGLKVYRPTAGDWVSASGLLYDSVVGGTPSVRQLDQPRLNAAVRDATKRPSGDGWVWDPRKPGVDIVPLRAVTLAHWALATPRVHVVEPFFAAAWR